MAQDEDLARPTQAAQERFWVLADPLRSASLQPFNEPAPTRLQPANDAGTGVIQRGIRRRDEIPESIGADPLGHSFVTV